MWPFNSSKKEADDVPSLKGEIVQTSFNPTTVPDLNDDIELSPTSSLAGTQGRLVSHPVTRILLGGSLAGAAGFVSGFARGADVAALCYRAENAHLTPTSSAGWFLYSKSKNYHAVVGGTKQGVKTGFKYFGWAALFLIIEGGLDVARGRLLATKSEKEEGLLRKGQADVFNTLSAAVAVAGIHGWWNGLDRFASSRTTRSAIKFALPIGLAQDFVAWRRGERVWYAESALRLMGKGLPESESQTG